MTAHGDATEGGGGDIEALISRANELSQLDTMGNFTIGDDEDELEGDYESITTDEGDELPNDISETGGLIANPEKDFALAERTSNIISNYRDYLTEMESVTATNQRLTDEMDSLRGSLGPSKVTCDPPVSFPTLPAKYGRELNDIEIQEEQRSTKYSQPLIHSRQLKKRLLGAAVGVVVLGSVAVASFYAAERSHTEKNLPDWDQELAQALKEEEVTREGLIHDAASRSSRPAKSQASVTEAEQPPEKKDNPAMNIIQEMIAHPEDVKMLEFGRGAGKRAKAEKGSTSKSGKSILGFPYGKSGKSSLSYETTKDVTKVNQKKKKEPSSILNPKADKKSSSKSGKSSHASAMTAPPMTKSHKEARDANLHLEAASILYKAIGSQYNPLFFDQSHGWEGNSFSEAAYFCENHYPKDIHGRPGVPCPYEAYCPEGPNSIPFGGYRSDTSYAPIIDVSDHWLGWVQLSEGHPCVAYNSLNPTEEETRLIMCCKDVTR